MGPTSGSCDNIRTKILIVHNQHRKDFLGVGGGLRTALRNSASTPARIPNGTRALISRQTGGTDASRSTGRAAALPAPRGAQTASQMRSPRSRVSASVSLSSSRSLAVAATRGGDFGDATDLPAHSIRTALDDAGLRCRASWSTERELAAEQIDTVLGWVRGVGADRVVLTAFTGSAGSTLEQWRATLARANTHAERCRERGVPIRAARSRTCGHPSRAGGQSSCCAGKSTRRLCGSVRPFGRHHARH